MASSAHEPNFCPPKLPVARSIGALRMLPDHREHFTVCGRACGRSRLLRLSVQYAWIMPMSPKSGIHGKANENIIAITMNFRLCWYLRVGEGGACETRLGKHAVATPCAKSLSPSLHAESTVLSFISERVWRQSTAPHRTDL